MFEVFVVGVEFGYGVEYVVVDDEYVVDVFVCVE